MSESLEALFESKYHMAFDDSLGEHCIIMDLLYTHQKKQREIDELHAVLSSDKFAMALNGGMDGHIKSLFEKYWKGDAVLKNVDTMHEQLYKTLCSLRDGYWSGYSAYQIALDGMFILNGPSGKPKLLTVLGKKFIADHEKTASTTPQKRKGKIYA